MIYYHFVSDTLRDGRAIPPDGAWLIHDGPVVMCKSGLHASGHPFDALQYAPGNTLCMVEMLDIVDSQEDKVVSRGRRIVKRIDAAGLCRAFARECALSVAHLWDMPAIVREYLETGDESKRAEAHAVSANAYAAANAANAAATNQKVRDLFAQRVADAFSKVAT